jgi:hypothetical protein
VGLALDEPKDGDLREVVEGVEFVMARRDEDLLLHRGPVVIRYSDRGWWRGYRASVSGPGTC